DHDVCECECECECVSVSVCVCLCLCVCVRQWRKYNRQKMDVDARQMKTQVGRLQPNTSYEFRMSCQDSGEGAQQHRVQTRTSPPIQMKRPEFDMEREPASTLTIILPPLVVKDIIK